MTVFALLAKSAAVVRSVRTIDLDLFVKSAAEVKFANMTDCGLIADDATLTQFIECINEWRRRER